MDLVEEIQLNPEGEIMYTCSMHPEIIEDQPGACPMCGMNLILKKTDASVEEKNYLELLRKFWAVCLLLLCQYSMIAMSEMVPGNPLVHKFLTRTYWNWIQLLLSLACRFLYLLGCFSKGRFSSVRTWNLNMFTLIGIGAGSRLVCSACLGHAVTLIYFQLRSLRTEIRFSSCLF